MSTLRKITLSAFLSCLVVSPLFGQVQLEIIQPTPRAQDANFVLAGTTGFSVSFVIPDEYRLYATTHVPRIKWNAAKTGMEDLFFGTTSCYYTNDPRTWDGRCIDSIGLFTKKIGCGGNPACEWDGRWNAYPGSANVSKYPVTWLWPKQNDYGVAGFTPLLSKDKVNSVVLQPQGSSCVTGSPCPPKTGAESVCHPHNPDSYATGAANSKPVQVYYSGGVSRWFMAFNEQMHSEANQGFNGSDNWRILWARSEDGKSWTVDPAILFRSTSETSTGYCGLGLLVTDMFLDTGKFYMTFTDVGTSAVYMVRSQIASYGTNPGYGTWSIAALPLVNGKWTWKTLTLGVQQDLASLGAANILPTRMSNPGFTVKQSDIGRVFTSATPGSASRYIALTSDVQSGQPQVLQVWSTDSLDKPFQYESTVDLSAVSVGGNGLEVAFTQYHDNLPTSPRLVASQLDFWIVQHLTNPSVPGDLTPTVSVSRFTARLHGGIYGF